MTEVTQGYALMRTPASAFALYEQSDFARSNSVELSQLRSALPHINAAAYRGISRDPLEALPKLSARQPEDIERRGVDPRTNEPARRLLREMGIPTYPGDPHDPYLLPTRSAAQQVQVALACPGDYEIVILSRDLACVPAECFGFDIGYWGSDHFSLICDSAIAPQWHPRRC